MPQKPRHKVFISFHNKDQHYKDWFLREMSGDIVDKSVSDGDIDDRNMKTTTIRQKIRDEFIADASVTIVLIGSETYTRKHVDWEISSSLRKTKKNPRCGLVGILLPNHPDYATPKFREKLIPPRLSANTKGKDPFARIYHWPKGSGVSHIRQWIDEAFQRRDGTPPNNALKPFARNRKPVEFHKSGRKRDRSFRKRRGSF